ncbi:unnamed protein product, partial [Boreogadus saida]
GQQGILFAANQPIKGSITEGPLAAGKSLQAPGLRQGRRPCHEIITMMNTAAAFYGCDRCYHGYVGGKVNNVYPVGDSSGVTPHTNWMRSWVAALKFIINFQCIASTTLREPSTGHTAS